MTLEQLNKSKIVLNRLLKDKSISIHEYNLIHNFLQNAFNDKHVDSENRNTCKSSEKQLKKYYKLFRDI